ncbi:MAG: hypothetical protein Q6352_008440 [Candidatus Freyrarchaeum guaymaensis]|nr:hypothetical protein [Candidatus Sigynarchaeota archaeon]
MEKTKLMEVTFKDPQLPPGKNQRTKYVNKYASVSEVVEAAKNAFDIPDDVAIALLHKGVKLNPDKKFNDYDIPENAILMIVPDRIEGG